MPASQSTSIDHRQHAQRAFLDLDHARIYRRLTDVTDSISRTNALVRESFAAVAENYRRSRRHGDPAPLRAMLALLEPAGHERVLDVATGGGHTAAALAPFVARLVATDLLPEMLEQARRLFAEARIANVDAVCADAHALPFGRAAFDLVTCRCAPHHFGDLAQACAEIARVLRPGGRLYVNDCGAPGDPAVAAFVNEVERLRDPSHVRACSAGEWGEMLRKAGFEIELLRELPNVYRVPEWLDHLALPPERRADVLAKLADPPAGLERFFTIDLTPGRETFSTVRVEALAAVPSR
jgi:ubiquinone/menaquinone biosynthesis C-methylase UbiE